MRALLFPDSVIASCNSYTRGKHTAREGAGRTTVPPMTAGWCAQAMHHARSWCIALPGVLGYRATDPASLCRLALAHISHVARQQAHPAPARRMQEPNALLLKPSF